MLAAPPPLPAQRAQLTVPAAASFKRDTELVEYDLDNEDEDWLAAFNGGQARLPAEKCARFVGPRRACVGLALRRVRLRFEAMLWRLELACADAQAAVRAAA